jgi:hypothetical protein
MARLAGGHRRSALDMRSCCCRSPTIIRCALRANGYARHTTGRSATIQKLGEFSVPPDETRARWEEGLRILLNIWKSQDGTFSWKGRYFDIPERTVVPMPIQGPVIGEAR